MTRGDRAKELFLEGYNCSQAVAIAFSDIIGMDEQTIAKLVSGYGGGMGRMREVCGTVSGAVFVLSSIFGYDDPKASNEKKALYEHIQEFGKRYAEQNGSIVCRELLGLDKKGFDSPTPQKRTTEYYKKRPCPELVKSSADILEEYINTLL